MSMNVCMFAGKVFKDAEVKEVGSSKVTRFTLLVADDYKKEGEKFAKNNFLDFEVWGEKPAENAAKYLQKGVAIEVSASAKQETWEDKNTGSKRSAIKFKVDRWWFAPSSNGKKTEEDTSTKTEGGDPGFDSGDEPSPF